ncbi:hypothetical protein BD410DRAFT_331643 [Rickenella mellea]|uniref:Uncharacterized protein n=1 Tax=Rickenella mellea TaxID=50990 RepID=A0A4Y7QKT4_9AGAM|nr:hypothetical protein BD410DRAFT_331643 [Rickenella mellea]
MSVGNHAGGSGSSRNSCPCCLHAPSKVSTVKSGEDGCHSWRNPVLMTSARSGAQYAIRTHGARQAGAYCHVSCTALCLSRVHI